MPEPLSSEELEAITRMAAKVVDTFGDDWPLHYDGDFGEVICKYEDEDAPFTDVYIEVFRTSQWMEDQKKSPLAEFLAASIVVIPRLIADVERRLPLEDVERFLKRERDEYEPRGECWNTVDDVLDCFRLHMVTGTPLTEPRPEEGPSDPSVGSPPLTEAEELRAEVDRLKAENELLRRLHVGAENSINAALDLAARLDPTCGHTRVRAFIADLLRTLTTTPQKVVGD